MTRGRHVVQHVEEFVTGIEDLELALGWVAANSREYGRARRRRVRRGRLAPAGGSPG